MPAHRRLVVGEREQVVDPQRSGDARREAGLSEGVQQLRGRGDVAKRGLQTRRVRPHDESVPVVDR
jgi:hypothetical protein